MKFNRCHWSRVPSHRWSPQRLAAAKRAVTKEQARVAEKRDQVALFPEMMAAHQPAYTDVPQRQAIIDRRETYLTLHFRATRAASWRSARSSYFALRPGRRQGLLRLWQSGLYPADPAYLATMLQEYTRTGHSPWTHLRKKRLVILIRDGRLPRPASMMTITHNWKSL